MPAIPALRRKKQESQEFKVLFSYLESLWPVWARDSHLDLRRE